MSERILYCYYQAAQISCLDQPSCDTQTNDQHANIEFISPKSAPSLCIRHPTMAFITPGFIARRSGRFGAGCTQSRCHRVAVRSFPRAEVASSTGDEAEEKTLVSDRPETEAKDPMSPSPEPEAEPSQVVEESVPLVSDRVLDERDVLQAGIADAVDTLASGGDLYTGGAAYYDSMTLPKLYDAWFAPSHELWGAMSGAIARAHADGVRQMELQWPVVPNLEEIEAGTRLNQLFGFLVAADLGLTSRAQYPLIKRYLASFSNLYWAKRVAAAAPFRESKSVVVRTDSVRLDDADLTGIDEVVSARRQLPKLENDDVAIMIDPRYNDAWYNAAKMRKGAKDSTVVFLNSQFSETYGLTGPRRWEMKETEVVYMLKRVTRGYVFKSYGAPWRAYLEKPDCSVEVVEEYEKEPKLSTVAKRVREESNSRYGGFYNDRYVRGLGGRL